MRVNEYHTATGAYIRTFEVTDDVLKVMSINNSILSPDEVKYDLERGKRINGDSKYWEAVDDEYR